MRYPDARLLRISTRHATYPMLHVKFSDGSIVVMPQVWADSPPRAHVPVVLAL